MKLTSSTRLCLRAITPLALGLFFGSLLAISGCKKSTIANTDISGKVTYKGAPVPGGTLTFVSTAAGNPFVPCAIGADGTYHLQGVTPGPNKVTVDTDSLRPSTEAEDMAKRSMSKEDYEKYKKMMTNKGGGAAADSRTYVQIPKKYADSKTTTLNYDVKEGKQVIDVDLPD